MDIIIAVGHAGYKVDKMLAEHVEELDLVVGGENWDNQSLTRNTMIELCLWSKSVILYTKVILILFCTLAPLHLLKYLKEVIPLM